MFNGEEDLLLSERPKRDKKGLVGFQTPSPSVAPKMPTALLAVS
jgi:hypothetical protein